MNNRIPNGYDWPDTASAPDRFATENPELTFKDKATESASGVMRKAGEFIGMHPVPCLATAITCGVLVGWLVKRRI